MNSDGKQEEARGQISTVDRAGLPLHLAVENPRLAIEGSRAASLCFLPLVRGAAALTRLTGRHGMGRLLDNLDKNSSARARTCTAQLANDAFFKFRATDSYWGFYFYGSLVYEPSLHILFRALRGVDYQVLDCGANFGYWSVLLSSSVYGNRNVVSVEASAKSFESLQRNRGLNSNRFTCVHGAVAACSGQTLLLEREHHASAHLAPGGLRLPSQGEEVRSISLDDACSMLRPQPDRLVVKLDIEGAEVDAVRDARCVRDWDTLIIYEDNTSDTSSSNSRYFLDQGHFAIYWVDYQARLISVSSLDQVMRIKALTSKGRYRCDGCNFVAVTRGRQLESCLRQNLRWTA